MPGKKNFVSVKKEAVSYSNEAVSYSKEEVSYSKVTSSEQLERGVLWVQGEISRTKNWIFQICLSEAKALHFGWSQWYTLQWYTLSLCVHNLRLMMMEMQLPELPTYHHCWAKSMCNPQHPRCYLGEYNACPRIEKLHQELLTQLDENTIDQIVYKQWVSTDRSTYMSEQRNLVTFVASWSSYIPILYCKRAGFVLRNL